MVNWFHPPLQTKVELRAGDTVIAVVRSARQLEPEQLHIAIGSQLNASFLLSLCRAHGPFDVVIDDAAHMAAMTPSQPKSQMATHGMTKQEHIIARGETCGCQQMIHRLQINLETVDMDRDRVPAKMARPAMSGPVND